MTKEKIKEQLHSIKHRAYRDGPYVDMSLLDEALKLVEQIMDENYLVDRKALSDYLVPYQPKEEPRDPLWNPSGISTLRTSLAQDVNYRSDELKTKGFKEYLNTYAKETFGYKLENLQAETNKIETMNESVEEGLTTSRLFRNLINMDTPKNLVKMTNLLQSRGLDSYESLKEYFERADLESDIRMNEALDRYYHGSRDRLL